jgi:hypothetical protein
MSDPHVTTRFAPDGGLALANVVRSSDLNPNFPSHDWHVQPYCQRPKSRFRLSGAFSVQMDSELNPSVLETFLKISSLKISSCLRASQLPEFTGFPQNKLRGERSYKQRKLSPQSPLRKLVAFSRSRIHLATRYSADLQRLTISARADSEDYRLR